MPCCRAVPAIQPHRPSQCYVFRRTASLCTRMCLHVPRSILLSYLTHYKDIPTLLEWRTPSTCAPCFTHINLPLVCTCLISPCPIIASPVGLFCTKSRDNSQNETHRKRVPPWLVPRAHSSVPPREALRHAVSPRPEIAPRPAHASTLRHLSRRLACGRPSQQASRHRAPLP